MSRPAVEAVSSDAGDWRRGADDVGLGMWAQSHGVTMVNSEAWVTEYTRWRRAGPGRLEKVSLREKGFHSAAACDSVEPLLLANFSVVHPSCINGPAIAAACGVAWSRGAQEQNSMVRLWHAYLGRVGARSGCDAIEFSRARSARI